MDSTCEMQELMCLKHMLAECGEMQGLIYAPIAQPHTELFIVKGAAR